MPCFFPLRSFFSIRPDGKKAVRFASYDYFKNGLKPENGLLIPCGRCMGCRLEHSRQWAMRCVHESKCFSDSCFITLTYDPEHLPADGSLVRKHTQDFMKRLRDRFDGLDAVMVNDELRKPIRYYGCGEYGDEGNRPHYHFCLFNFDFPDRKYLCRVNGFNYYTSEVLREIWGFGNVTVCDFSFETAAYVARYCTKKVTGDKAAEHYAGRLPEFSMMSTKPGIGKLWLDKFGDSDVFPHDSCIARGRECKVPRYYDKVRERLDPVGFVAVKEARKVKAESRADDFSFDRLNTKLKCMASRFTKLFRRFDGSN